MIIRNNWLITENKIFDLSHLVSIIKEANGFRATFSSGCFVRLEAKEVKELTKTMIPVDFKNGKFE